MARYVVKVLASTDTLKKLERAIQQLEEIDFTAVSVSSGTVGGKKGNLLTLLRGAPDGRVTLHAIDGGDDDEGQSDQMNELADGGEVVSYGAIYVGGALKNVALIRS